MATSLGPALQIAPGDLTMDVAATTASLSQLGALCFSPDGRSFRVASAGGTALVPGKLQQTSAEVTANQDLAVAAAAIGATSVTTTSTVTVTANQYAGGLLVVTVTPGQGYAYLISSHPAATAAALTLTLAEPLVVALTTSSRIDLVANRFAAVIVNPTTASSAPCGAAVHAVTANQVGFVQVGGSAALLADAGGAVTVGDSVVASNQTAGAVENSTGAQAVVGTALTGIASNEYGAVNLFLS